MIPLAAMLIATSVSRPVFAAPATETGTAATSGLEARHGERLDLGEIDVAVRDGTLVLRIQSERFLGALDPVWSALYEVKRATENDPTLQARVEIAVPGDCGPWLELAQNYLFEKVLAPAERISIVDRCVRAEAQAALEASVRRGVVSRPGNDADRPFRALLRPDPERPGWQWWFGTPPEAEGHDPTLRLPVQPEARSLRVAPPPSQGAAVSRVVDTAATELGWIRGQTISSASCARATGWSRGEEALIIRLCGDPGVDRMELALYGEDAALEALWADVRAALTSGGPGNEGEDRSD